MIFTIKKLECGCKIQKRTFEPITNIKHWIDYCFKHKAAPELLEACKHVLHNLKEESVEVWEHEITHLEYAINKAEGKEV